MLCVVWELTLVTRIERKDPVLIDRGCQGSSGVLGKLQTVKAMQLLDLLLFRPF